MKIKGFITHKRAESYSDCADYFNVNPDTRKIAVSDGVSQSFDPQDWSKLLVNSFTSGLWIPGEEIKAIQSAWLDKIRLRLKALAETGAVTYGMENAINSRVSAGATFCGLSFQGLHWTCDVLGDSSLIRFSPAGEMTICSSQEGTFDNRPDYYDSYAKEPVGEIKTFEGDLEKGGRLLLVSDPFSDLFQKAESEGRPLLLGLLLGLLLSIDTQEDFCRIVEKLRDEYGMHNDDSTLVVVEYDGSDALNVEYLASLEEMSD